MPNFVGICKFYVWSCQITTFAVDLDFQFPPLFVCYSPFMLQSFYLSVVGCGVCFWVYFTENLLKLVPFDMDVWTQRECYWFVVSCFDFWHKVLLFACNALEINWDLGEKWNFNFSLIWEIKFYFKINCELLFLQT